MSVSWTKEHAARKTLQLCCREPQESVGCMVIELPKWRQEVSGDWFGRFAVRTVNTHVDRETIMVVSTERHGGEHSLGMSTHYLPAR